MLSLAIASYRGEGSVVLTRYPMVRGFTAGPKRPIGREGETAALSRFLGAIPHGPVSLVLSGEPGIGKSLLWLEGIRLAREGDIRVYTHRADASEAKLSFQGLADVFDGASDEMLLALPDPQARAMEIALLRAEEDGAPPDARAMSMATLGLIRSLSASGPIVLAIDDVQWLDAPSARALRFALRRLDEEPVGLLVSLRDRAAAEEQGSPQLLEHLRDDATDLIRVGPLALDSIDELLRDRLGLTLPSPQLRELHRVVAGNPLFALEMGQVLARSPAPKPGEPLPVPAGLRDLMRARVTSLPALTREALEVVAALSRPTVEILRASLRRDPSLDPALDEGIIEADAHSLRFSHPLIGSVVYAECPPSRKRRLHRSLAGVVEDPEERARHLALAATGPSRSVAEALDRAAESALRRGAPETAAELLEMARSLTPRDDPVGRRQRASRSAESHILAADSPRAKRLLEEELATCPPGIERSRLLVPLALLVNDLTASEALIEEAKRQAEGDPALLLRCEYSLASRLFLVGDLPAAARGAQATVELAERLGDDAWMSLALTSLELDRFLLGDGLDIERLERALALEASAKSRPALVEGGYFYNTAGTWFGCELMWSGELDEARLRLAEVRARALDHGDEQSATGLLLHMTELECLAGNLDRARQHAEAFERAGAREGVQLQANLYPLALAYAHVGRVDEGRAAGDEGIRFAREAGDVVFEAQCRRASGFLELSAGDLTASRRHLERAAECVDGMGVVDPNVFPYSPDLIEVLIGEGEGRRAEALIEGLEEKGQRLGRPWALAAASRCRALLLARAGNVPEAVEEAERSLKQISRLPSLHPVDHGRTLLVLGGLRRRARQKRAAREALEEALRTFRDTGAVLWAGKAAAELGRIGGRPSAPLELTASEERVAELAAAGQTNREIAEALFMSVRTVESTLTKVYRKTGSSSRGELRRLPRFDNKPRS